MSTRGAVLSLPSGAEIAYDEYGDPHGKPVIFCHGWPSSRSMAQLTHAAAAELGVRVISPDRPGINGSTYLAGRELLDWPPIVKALAEHLSLGNFRLLGISGGGPYALAAAWALPGEVEATAIVSGAPAIASLADRSGLLRLYRVMLGLYAKQPELLRALFHIARPFASTRPPLRIRPLLLRLLQPCDADVLRDSAAFEACFESARRAWRGSARGVITDAEIYARPWGFPLEEVSGPIQLWHGTKDRTFSFRLARDLAARLLHCELTLVEGAGHYSLPIRHMQEILAKLCA
ncbi:MAG: alpha/beta hydrolase [Verrucomicrobiota bacterium]|nr:alpha/beta hydrolase [Verrucomicrobiota bacterium]